MIRKWLIRHKTKQPTNQPTKIEWEYFQAVEMHKLDFQETNAEKSTWELHKNTISSLE